MDVCSYARERRGNFETDIEIENVTAIETKLEFEIEIEIEIEFYVSPGSGLKCDGANCRITEASGEPPGGDTPADPAGIFGA